MLTSVFDSPSAGIKGRARLLEKGAGLGHDSDAAKGTVLPPSFKFASYRSVGVSTTAGDVEEVWSLFNFAYTASPAISSPGTSSFSG